MADKELDELFRRFVREHDVRAVGELFDAAAPQLARIAWHLTHDASGVEDLVQTTFLTALASAHEFADERRVMPWLLRILLNHARNARRASERKPEPLDVDLVDPRTPESDLERRELHEVVQRAVADLPDTYREVVSTWLIEGATPTEIAHRTGKPAATVRVQLRRGLELLRSGLPAGVAGLLAPNGWSASSFAASREVVLAKATQIARTLAPTSALVAGGLLMTSKWLIFGAAAIVTAAGVGWLVHNSTVEPTTVASAPVVSANELHVPNQTAAVDAPTAERDEVVPAPSVAVAEAAKSPALGWWLIVDVAGVSETDRAQLSSPPNETWSAEVVGTHFEIDLAQLFASADLGVRIDRLRGVEARGADDPTSRAQVRAGELRQQLREKLGPAPASFVVGYDQARFLPTHVVVDVDAQLGVGATPASERVELHVRIAPRLATLIVEGRVVAPAELDASDAVAALYTIDSQGAVEDDPADVVRCSKDGSFRARCATSGAHALALVLPGMRPSTRSFAADLGGLVALGDLTLEPGEHFAGVVDLDAAAEVRASAVEARVTPIALPHSFNVAPRTGAWQWRDSVDLAWIEDRFEWCSRCVDVPSSGEFRIGGLAPKEHALRVSLGTTQRPHDDTPTLMEWSRPTSMVAVPTQEGIVLPARDRCVRLDIRCGDQPVDGAMVTIDGHWGIDLTEQHVVDVHWSGPGTATISIAREGFAPTELVVAPDEHEPRAVRIVQLVRDPNFASLVLRPIVACEGGGVYSVQVRGSSADGTALHKDFRSFDESWRFDGLVPGRYRVDVRTSTPMLDTSWCVPPALDVELKPGEAIVRDLPFASGGRVAITVRDDHAPTATIESSGSERSLMEWKFFDTHTGRTEQRGGFFDSSVPIGARIDFVTPLEAGPRTFTITLDDAGHARRERTINVVPGQTTELVVDFSKPNER